MSKQITCTQCGHKFSGKNNCPECNAVSPAYYKPIRIAINLLMIIALIIAIISIINNLRFISNTVEITGKVIEVGSQTVSGRMHYQDSIRYTAVIQYKLPDGSKQHIYIYPIFQDIQWFNYGETVPVRYSTTGEQSAQPTKFIYFWNTTWASLLMILVYYVILLLLPKDVNHTQPKSVMKTKIPIKSENKKSPRLTEEEIKKNLQEKLRKLK